MSSHDLEHYTPWRKSRIAKLEQIFGKEYFCGKTMLELGAGNGLIGKYFREQLGAIVTFTDGRIALIEKIRQNNPDAEIILVDHDKSWDLGKRFDFIIHWGLLYHLDNWQQDLECVVRHLNPGGILTLEACILDSFEDEEVKCDEVVEHDDQALNGMGTQPSAIRIENHLKSLNLEFKRYDDTDLNADFHHYDWLSVGKMKYQSGQRRFWVTS